MREGEKGQKVRERGLHGRGMEYVEARLILISVHATSAGLPATSARTIIRSNGRWQRQMWGDKRGGKS